MVTKEKKVSTTDESYSNLINFRDCKRRRYTQRSGVYCGVCRRRESRERCCVICDRFLSHVFFHMATSCFPFHNAICVPYARLPWFLERPIPGQSITLADGSTVFIRDPSINHPYRENTVTETMLFSLVGFGLVAILALECTGARASRSRRCAAGMWAAATFANEYLTLSFKCYCGVLRPNFYATCGWNDTEQRCTNGLNEAGRVSFPSGHSSHSACFAVLVMLHLIRHHDLRLAAKHTTDEDVTARAMRLAAPLPIVIAAFVAFSRVHDNAHHPADVVAGAALGAAVAYSIHRTVYPDSRPSPHGFGPLGGAERI